MKKVLLTLVAVVSMIASFAIVRLPTIFGNQMVLQRNQAIPIWGWADKNEKITVEFNMQKKTVKAGKDGKWRVNLDAENAGGPYTLTVKGKKNTITINDVLVGEVWICSGQSNMEFHVDGVYDAENAIKNANYPQIRHVEVKKDVAGSPREDLAFSAVWKTAVPENVKDFTAVGYFFAEKLYNELKVPIGLIHTSWGGTDVETWTSRGAFENSPEFKDMIRNLPSTNIDSMADAKRKKLDVLIKDLQGGIPEPSTVATWKESAYDDSKWPQMNVPEFWETQGLLDLDGVVWLRKTIEIAPEDAGKAAQIELAQIDDSDDTYVNGTKVGSTINKHAQSRIYNIPAGILKAGKNVIAVRVEDTGGNGGIYGDAKFVKLTVDGKVISLAGSWKYQVASVVRNTGSVNPNSYPTLLYNAMINPLIPYGIRGAIWYQGESNAGRAYQYRTAFPLMITDWRQHWGQGNFPFYFVQLATFNANNGNSQKGSSWAELREAQAMTLSLPNTGMAVTTDIGDAVDIHPRNKQDVGKRLAAIALHDVYNQNNEFSGPLYQSFKVEGNKAIISFTHANELWAKDNYGYLKGFEIAGADKKFRYAKATINGNQVIVYQDGVATPVAVRYNWADNASDGNLYNKEGFPAAPFRTDNWKGITEAAKYRK